MAALMLALLFLRPHARLPIEEVLSYNSKTSIVVKLGEVELSTADRESSVRSVVMSCPPVLYCSGVPQMWCVE